MDYKVKYYIDEDMSEDKMKEISDGVNERLAKLTEKYTAMLANETGKKGHKVREDEVDEMVYLIIHPMADSYYTMPLVRLFRVSPFNPLHGKFTPPIIYALVESRYVEEDDLKELLFENDFSIFEAVLACSDVPEKNLDIIYEYIEAYGPKRIMHYTRLYGNENLSVETRKKVIAFLKEYADDFDKQFTVIGHVTKLAKMTGILTELFAVDNIEFDPKDF